MYQIKFSFMRNEEFALPLNCGFVAEKLIKLSLSLSLTFLTLKTFFIYDHKPDEILNNCILIFLI